MIKYKVIYNNSEAVIELTNIGIGDTAMKCIFCATI